MRQNGNHRRIILTKVLSGFALIALLVTLYHYLFHTGLGEILFDSNRLKSYVQSLGALGPGSIIFFMTLAIVMSPIPSAPIAIVSGTIFGHWWGTLYVIIGAELGAVIAFLISRLAGFDLMKKWFGDKLSTGIFKSQKNLTLIVLLSRLIPFVSFDIISYAAGLTPISFLRFALATLLGILPISFLLTHFGSNLGSSNPQKIMSTIFLLGLVTAIPIVLAKIKKK